MTCYLVRHGMAAAGSNDWTRPLTPEGRAAVEGTARALAARGAEVAEIRHSGLVRARETAEIMGGVLTPAGGVRATIGLAPEDAPDVAAAELERAVAPLMLVGHLPHLARLAAALVGGATLERVLFAPATAVGLRRGAGVWEVELVVPPRVEAAP